MSDKLTIRTNRVPRHVLSWVELTTKERKDFDYLVAVWFCEDCTQCAVNDDTTGIEDQRREKEVRRAVSRMLSNISPNWDSATGDGINDWSQSSCDCCGSRAAGERHRFADFERAYSASFVRYKGIAYDLADFMTWNYGVTPQMNQAGFTKWDGYQSDSFFSGVLVRYCKDTDYVVMATYYS